MIRAVELAHASSLGRVCERFFTRRLNTIKAMAFKLARISWLSVHMRSNVVTADDASKAWRQGCRSRHNLHRWPAKFLFVCYYCASNQTDNYFWTLKNRNAELIASQGTAEVVMSSSVVKGGSGRSLGYRMSLWSSIILEPQAVQ